MLIASCPTIFMRSSRLQMQTSSRACAGCGQLGENHSGELKFQTAEAKAERIIAEELKRRGWKQADLQLRLKSDPAKLQIATRLRSETTLTIKAIAERLHLGTAKSANIRLHNFKNTIDSQRRGNVMV